MELQEYLDSQLPQGEERERFIIDDEQKANWAMRKIKHLQEKKQEKEKIAKEEIERINQWLQAETESIDRDIEFFSGLLEAYMRDLNRKDPRKKSLSLIHGRLQLRKQQPIFKYDDKKLVEWLKKTRHTNLVRVEEKPDKKELRKLLVTANGKAIIKSTGEIVEGIEVEERNEPAFSLKVGE